MAIKLVDVKEAKEALDSDAKAVYVDVRTEAEFGAGHPEGAVNIPVMIRGAMGMQPNPDFLAVAQKVLDQGQRILCGCQMGGRSQRAAQLLDEAGYGDVSNVIGGFGGGPDPRDGSQAQGWRDAQFPVTAEATEREPPWPGRPSSSSITSMWEISFIAV